MASALPTKMRCIIQPSPLTSPLKLTLDRSVAVPEPAADELLLRVRAFAPCRGELLWARDFPSSVPATRFAVPGQDVAGIIVGPSPLPTSALTRGLGLGQRAFARIESDRPGAGRDYATVRISELARIPDSVTSWAEAASIPLSAMTAWQALFWQAPPSSTGRLDERAILTSSTEDEIRRARETNAGKRVLITGASGAVGGWAVQLARAARVGRIIAVGSGEEDKVAAMRALGATDVLDYKTTRTSSWVEEDKTGREVDLVVDCVGGKGLADLWTAVKDGGHIASVSTDPEGARPAGTKAKSTGQFFIVSPLGSNLELIGALLEKGVVRPLLDTVYPFERFQEAFDRVESGKGGMGKVVVSVSEDGQ